MRQRLRPRADRDDDGISLVEVMVALFALTLVSVAAASFFVNGVRTTAVQARQQQAAALATQSLEAVQAVPVSQVLLGRSHDAVATLTASSPLSGLLAQDVLVQDDTNGATNYDPQAATAAGVVVPLTQVQTVQGTDYSISTAIDRCWLSRSAQTCTRLAPADAVAVLRATVLLTWGSSCGRCTYSASVLLDKQDDPLFRLATTQPVIVTTVPDNAVQGSLVTITLSGNDFAAGPVLTLPLAAGTLTNVVRSTDGKRVTANWAVSANPGKYVLALTNSDGGRAEYSPLTVKPTTVADCLATSTNGNVTVPVMGNDTPSTGGTVALLSGSAFTVNTAGTALVFNAPNGTAADFTASYVLTVNGASSAATAVTVHFKNSVAC